MEEAGGRSGEFLSLPGGDVKDAVLKQYPCHPMAADQHNRETMNVDAAENGLSEQRTEIGESDNHTLLEKSVGYFLVEGGEYGSRGRYDTPLSPSACGTCERVVY